MLGLLRSGLVPRLLLTRGDSRIAVVEKERVEEQHDIFVDLQHAVNGRVADRREQQKHHRPHDVDGCHIQPRHRARGVFFGVPCTVDLRGAEKDENVEKEIDGIEQTVACLIKHRIFVDDADEAEEHQRRVGDAEQCGNRRVKEVDVQHRGLLQPVGKQRIGDDAAADDVGDERDIADHAEDDVIYLSKQDVANFFDKYIYEEREGDKIITTYDKKIAEIGFEENNIIINGSKKDIYAHAIRKDDNIYLPISEMKDVYDIEIENIADTKVITMDSLDREQKKAIVSSDLAVKSSTNFIAKTVDRVKKGDTVIVISSDKGYSRIRTANGKLRICKI